MLPLRHRRRRVRYADLDPDSAPGDAPTDDTAPGASD